MHGADSFYTQRRIIPNQYIVLYFAFLSPNQSRDAARLLVRRRWFSQRAGCGGRTLRQNIQIELIHHRHRHFDRFDFAALTKNAGHVG